jgi:hypothetical protein
MLIFCFEYFMVFQLRGRVDAIIIDTVDVIIVAVIACAWDLSVHVNFLQLNHFTGSSGLYILCS